MTNLKDLAAHLGLSQATVSRALNDYATVSPKTRVRVLEAAKALDYRPNTSARRLATGRAGAFGLVLDQSDDLLNDPHFVDFLSAFSAELAEMDIDVLISASKGLSSYQRLAETGKVDGVVISAPKVRDERVTALIESEFPFVVHGQTQADAPYAFFDVENRAAFEDATRLLLDLGHTRIAFINGPQEMNFARERASGYRAALAARGVAQDSQLLLHEAMTEEAGFRGLKQLLELSEPPTAILCATTLQVLGLSRLMWDRGLRMGADLSVIAHDDGLSALKTENFAVPLTVTRAPIREAGQAIAHMLVALTKGAAVESQQKLASVELILRASTGMAPRG